MWGPSRTLTRPWSLQRVGGACGWRPKIAVGAVQSSVIEENKGVMVEGALPDGLAKRTRLLRAAGLGQSSSLTPTGFLSTVLYWLAKVYSSLSSCRRWKRGCQQ